MTPPQVSHWVLFVEAPWLDRRVGTCTPRTGATPQEALFLANQEGPFGDISKSGSLVSQTYNEIGVLDRHYVQLCWVYLQELLMLLEASYPKVTIGEHPTGVLNWTAENTLMLKYTYTGMQAYYILMYQSMYIYNIEIIYIYYIYIQTCECVLLFWFALGY